jgi:hypothetical protein
LRSFKFVSVALAVSLVVMPLCPTRAFADEAAAATGSALNVQPGDLGGNILGLDGKTPVQGAIVQLIDKDGKVVATATTDDKGVFQLGNRTEGDFTLKVGKASGHLVVKSGAQATSLRFVLDKDVALGAEKAGAQKVAAISTTGAVLVGVGCAVGGGIAVGGIMAGAGAFANGHTTDGKLGNGFILPSSP